MGLAAENSSSIWKLNMLKSTLSEGKKTEKSCVAADEIAKRALLDKKKSGDTSSSKKLCVCAPTTHPGSFRCRLHRATARSHNKKTKTTQTTVLSRFAKEVPQEANGLLHKSQYNSE